MSTGVFADAASGEAVSRTTAIRRAAPAVLALVLLAVLYACWVWTDALNDFGGDSAVYLLTARYFSPFSGADEAAAFFAKNSPYPPLYPLTLALSGGAENLRIAHELTAAFLLLGLGGLYAWLRTEGVARTTSILFLLVAGFIPGLYMQALYLHSETLFFACAALSLALLARDEPSRNAVIGAALLAAAAALTRSIGVALIAAVLVSAFWRRLPGRGWAVAAGLLPSLLWALRPAAGDQESYTGVFLSRLASGETGGFAVIVNQAWALLDGWVVNITGAGLSVTAASVLGALCLIAAALRIRQKRADALFVFFYLGILLVWPFPAERVRFVMPVVAVLLAQLVLVSARIRLQAYNAAPIVMLACALTFLPNLLTTLSRFNEPPPASGEARHNPSWYEPAPREQRESGMAAESRFLYSLKVLSEWVPAGECVYSIKPALLGFYADRVSHRTPLPERGIADNGRCRYVFMVPFMSPTYSEYFYPMRAWSERIQVLQVTTMQAGDPQSPAIGILAGVKQISERTNEQKSGPAGK